MFNNPTAEKRTLKIGHIMPYPGIGGTEHATLRIASMTQEEGVDNHFFVPNGFDQIAAFFADQGFPVHTINRIEPSLRNFASYYVESKKSTKLFKDLDIDVLHAADLGAGFDNALAARCGSIPIVCHVRSLRPDISRRDRIFLRLVNHWLFVSASAKHNFACRASDVNSDILYDGVRLSEVSKETKLAARNTVLKEFGLKADTFIIGSLARISHQKDHLTLAKAIKEVSRDFPNIVTLAMGQISQVGQDAENYRTLLSFINNKGLQETIILGGFRTDTQVLMEAFDLHVLSTHTEGFPLVIHEAMAKRTPVIATAVGGVAEAMTDGIGGFLVEHGNARQLATKIKLLLTDHRRAKQMGDDGYEFVRANFSSERFRERLLEIYKKIIKH